MVLIKFGSYTPPSPTEYSVSLQDIDGEDTGRGETGYMTRERVRGGVYKIDVSFSNIPSADVLNIKNAVSPASISTTFFDGSNVTTDMYVGDRTLTLKSVDDTGNCFWDVSFSLTEF